MTSTTSTAPTGEQFILTRDTAFGPARAAITEVAAGLRELSIGGVDLTEPYPETVTPPFGDGIVLMPWPNRVADGLWNLDGAPQQLDITEPDRHNSLHGLLRYSPYRLVERDESSITLGAVVFPQHGYPFHLDTTVRYELTADGISVTHTVRNISAAKAPVAIGTHPFLTIGGVPTDDLQLTVYAATRFEVDARLNPIREIDVEGANYDLRPGRPVKDLTLDDAFGGLITVDGVSAVLRAPDGREVRLLQDDNHPYVQVFTTREFPKNGGHGLAVAVEPMTAPPNAFNTGIGVRWVEPGASWTVGWGIQYSG
ncbi:MAG: aldose 1-epimerase family protein [Rhodoglobus sp.]